MIKRCTRCVMDDSSDNTIVFNDNGQCNYCTEALDRMNHVYFPNEAGKRRIEEMISKMKSQGRKYDCIMGLSGGLDSSNLAYLGHLWGLRVLAVHIDDGFDTEISRNNLKKLVEATGFDYEVIVPDSEQFNALTLAYMKAGVPNIAVPQDNVLFAFLYAKKKEQRIKYFLSGGNFALESILQRDHVYKASDTTNIKAIHKLYGTKPINRLKFYSSIHKRIDSVLYGLQTLRPLDWIDYNRDRAFDELKAFCGFEYYGVKHLENIFTAFAQLYWLPHKFGIDKRTSHLSSMIISGQLTRDQDLSMLDEPMYDERLMDEYIAFIKKELGITDDVFRQIMDAPPHEHNEFAVEDSLLIYKLANWLYKKRRS